MYYIFPSVVIQIITVSWEDISELALKTQGGQNDTGQPVEGITAT
jgi:hypothetical protein